MFGGSRGVSDREISGGTYEGALVRGMGAGMLGSKVYGPHGPPETCYKPYIKHWGAFVKEKYVS